MRVHALLLAVVIAFLVIISRTEIALGYPENVRFGYAQCSSCHVAPSGGGAVTNYGRGAGEEMASFGREGDGRLFGLVNLPEQVAVGGDVRHVNINVPSQDFHRKFWMQADVEVAVKPLPYLWLAGSYGLYGEKMEPEMRRHYALWSPTEHLSLRVGRFIPTYGIMTSDHTVATRALAWREGTETLNAEVGVQGQWGEVFITPYLRGKEVLHSKGTDGYGAQSDETGIVARAAAFIGQSGVVGGSFHYADFPTDRERRYTGGPFVQWGITRELYLLTEADRQYTLPSDGTQTHKDVTWSQLGYEVVRGLHLKATHEYDQGNIPGMTVQWHPMPHYELVAESRRKQGTWSHILQFHYSW